MAFEKFIPEPNSRGPIPQVTIRPSGLISFDAMAVTNYDMRDVPYLVLFFDPKRKVIGVANTSDSAVPGAIPVSHRRRSMSIKSPEFFASYGLILDLPQRFNITFDELEGMLTIDVSALKRRPGRRRRL